MKYGKSALLSHLYIGCSEVWKVCIAITFVYQKVIRSIESLHCYHICISEGDPKYRKSALLSHLYIRR